MKHARWVTPCGGRSAMSIPTAIGTVFPYLDAETSSLRQEARLTRRRQEISRLFARKFALTNKEIPVVAAAVPFRG